MSIIRGVSESGFEYAIEETAPQSWDFLEAATSLQRGDLTGAIDMVNILFTGEEKKRFMDHIASIDPSRPTKLVMQECHSIINDMKTAKKSTPSQE